MKKLLLFVGGVVLFLGVYISGIIIDTYLPYGKDGGLINRILALGCWSGIFFLILRWAGKFKIVVIFLGFFVGIGCYIFYFFSCSLFDDPLKPLPDWQRNLSMTDDNFIAAAMVLLAGVVDSVIRNILEKYPQLKRNS